MYEWTDAWTEDKIDECKVVHMCTCLWMRATAAWWSGGAFPWRSTLPSKSPWSSASSGTALAVLFATSPATHPCDWYLRLMWHNTAGRSSCTALAMPFCHQACTASPSVKGQPDSWTGEEPKLEEQEEQQCDKSASWAYAGQLSDWNKIL